MRALGLASAIVGVLFALEAPAGAQPLPALPPPTAQPPQPEYAPAPQPQYAPPPPQPQYYPQQQPPPPPPPVIYTEPEMPVHAPKYSLWVGGKLGILGFGYNFYNNELGNAETTGNFVRNGLGVELDVGARLAKHYIPYVAFEHGIMGQGHRFEGSDAVSSTDFLGLGFRYTVGDVDSVGFLMDLAIGYRTVQVKSGNDTFRMTAFELGRLGLGAEIRISTLFVLSPLASISSGVMSDTSGTATYSPQGSGDGLKHPPPSPNGTIDGSNQRGYLVVGIGCGAHFDVFGK